MDDKESEDPRDNLTAILIVEQINLILGSSADTKPSTEGLEDADTPRDGSRQRNQKFLSDRSISRSRSRESRPSTKDTKSSKGTAGKPPARVTTQVKVTSKSSNVKESKSPLKPQKETAETAIQDEGGDPVSAQVETRNSKRARSTLETVKETEMAGDYDNAFELNDETAWSQITQEHIPGRFIQYRKLTQKKLSEIEDQLNLTVAKTQRKVNTLKSQFQEHKNKWEAERKVLIEQVEQAQKLQNEAEKEADVAMTQLEEFINEQERLEEEEEVKRQEVVKGVTKHPVKTSTATNVQDMATQMESEGSPQTVTPAEILAEGQKEPQVTREPTIQTEQAAEPTPQLIHTEETEQELSKLMQQTDDAKYERQRSDSKVVSRRSSSIDSDVAPWLLSKAPPPKPQADSSSDLDDDDRTTKASTSKASFRTRSERVHSEMSKLQDPKEDDEEVPTEVGSVIEEKAQSTGSRLTTPSVKDQKTPTISNMTAELQSSNVDGLDGRSSHISHATTGKESTKEASLSSHRSPSKQGDGSVASKHSRMTKSSSEDDEIPEAENAAEVEGSRPSTIMLEDLEERSRSLRQESSTEMPKSRRSSQIDMERRESEVLIDDGSRSIIEESDKSRSIIEESDTVTIKSRRSSRVDMERRASEVLSKSRRSSRVGFAESMNSCRSQGEGEDSNIIPASSVSRRSSYRASPTKVQEFASPERNGSQQTNLSRRDTRVSKRSSIIRLSGEDTLAGEDTEDEPIFSVEITQTSVSHSRRSPSPKKRSSSEVAMSRSRSSQGSPGEESYGQVQEMNSRLTSGAMSAPPGGIEGDSRSGSDSKDKINISGKTEEEIRASSALSRASLRNQYRYKLGEVRAAVEDRRAKSPAISIPSQRSLEDDQLIDDEDDDLPYTDEIKEFKNKESTMDIGTSPPPGPMKEEYKQASKGSRSSSEMTVDHPVVGEYLKAYDGVVYFRNALSKLMLDREMLQPSQVLADIDTMKFDKSGSLKPQIEQMTENLYHVLEEVMGVLGAMLVADREPMVSALNGTIPMSRDGTQQYQQVPDRASVDSGRGPTVTRASQHSSSKTPQSANLDKIALHELQNQYERLQVQFTEETRRHEEQLRHNTVVMMEMQDTINELQRELANLGRSSSRLRPGSDVTSQQVADSAIMFTRLDSERNAKIMKRAVNNEKMDAEKYKDAINKMDDYVSLPAQRLAHLVRKYTHHCRMKEIEENVKKSRSLNENVFEILDKMEALQNQRAKKWADRMDEMGSERIRLANLLMETLDSIEQESGIFLIKPMYSYRGRDVKDPRYGGKLTRPLKQQRHHSPMRDVQSAFAPAPTPASNVRSMSKQPQSLIQPNQPLQPIPQEQLAVRNGPIVPIEGDTTGVMGASLNWMGSPAARQTWSLNSSVVRGDPDGGVNQMNTPRILELDINRMMIGQNTISSMMSQPLLTDDRLVNASQNNLRSYITVNRPTASPTNPRPQPSMSFLSSTTKDLVPPSSPASTVAKKVRMSSDVEMPRNIPSTPPLPPIKPGSAGSGHDTMAEPPRSPPGSSLRQTPPHVQEVISPLK